MVLNSSETIILVLGILGVVGLFLPSLWTSSFSKKVGQLSSGEEGRLVTELSDEERANLATDLGLTGGKRGAETLLGVKLRHGNWSMTPVMYRSVQVAVSLLAFYLVGHFDARILQFASLAVGPLLVGGLLNRSITRRERLFDQDYGQFLISAAGLLKTGLSAPRAIEEAVQGLEPRSLVKQEILSLGKRLQLGIDEEQTIGQFARSIRHPEIELFIQALLLNRRIGGTLSDTFYRLAAQARRRQQFRLAAAASVAQQRSSIAVIGVLLIGVQCYLCWKVPDMVLRVVNEPVGWTILQSTVLMAFVGIWWSRVITNIRL
jgi:tight adherence protein B